MNVLNIAWKFDHNSAFSTAVNGDYDRHFFYAFKILVEDKKLRQIATLFGYFVGLIVFILNKIKVLTSIGVTDQLITLLKRNYANEIIINYLVKKYEIDVINLHWCGYGFLPTRSLDYIRGVRKLNVFHHDWYHLTSGGHVPNMLGGNSLADSLSINPGLNRPLIRNIFVSAFQLQQAKGLELSDCVIAENSLRESFTLSSKYILPCRVYSNRIINSPQFVVVFIGVRLGNNDNKGMSSATYILQHLAKMGIFSIGIGCDTSLPLSVSFSALAPPEVYQILSASDLSIITSRLETFSMVALESQFCKTPVVFRNSLAPSTFKDSSYLFPSSDDSDQSLLDTVLDCLTIKREI
jgi:hypothetical protein